MNARSQILLALLSLAADRQAQQKNYSQALMAREQARGDENLSHAQGLTDAAQMLALQQGAKYQQENPDRGDISYIARHLMPTSGIAQTYNPSYFSAGVTQVNPNASVGRPLSGTPGYFLKGPYG